MKLQHLQTLAALVATVMMAPVESRAAPITYSYTGTVESFYLQGGGTLPDGISIGSLVTGSFSYDAVDAGAPTLSYSTCGCGTMWSQGFPFATGFQLTTDIAGHRWSSSIGYADLTQSFMFSGFQLVTFGTYSEGGDEFENFPNSGEHDSLSLTFADNFFPFSIFSTDDLFDGVLGPINLKGTDYFDGYISAYTPGDEPGDAIVGYSIDFSLTSLRQITLDEPGTLPLVLSIFGFLWLRRAAPAWLAAQGWRVFSSAR